MIELISGLLKTTIFLGLTTAGILAITIWVKNLTRKVTIMRFFTQIMSLIAIFLTLPLLASWPSLVVGGIFLLTLFLGRFFCGWICPFGLYMDLITLLRTFFKRHYWKLSEKLNDHLHILRYGIVAGVLALPFLLGPLNPQIWRSFLLFQRPFTPLIVFFLGPLEPLIIPWPGLIGFSGFSLSYPYIREIIAYSPGPFFVSLNVFLFVASTAAASFKVRRFWCRFCPTGVSISILNNLSRFKWAPVLHLNKIEEKCTKCGICKRVCPVQITEVYEEKGGNVTSSKCMLCLRCVEMCPYKGCLELSVADKPIFESRNWLEGLEKD